MSKQLLLQQSRCHGMINLLLWYQQQLKHKSCCIQMYISCFICICLIGKKC
ncbi:unnamed protein product [Paramecium octaurelia]|uniref:Uncharacterized protein n=1 Tax=Paramecium octaurelia TaxID=43137 RepID=A0A8S1SHH6_PAROT|nr:unnamed protein product [Paramecium octaurelia]